MPSDSRLTAVPNALLQQLQAADDRFPKHLLPETDIQANAERLKKQVNHKKIIQANAIENRTSQRGEGPLDSIPTKHPCTVAAIMNA